MDAANSPAQGTIAELYNYIIKGGYVAENPHSVFVIQ